MSKSGIGVAGKVPPGEGHAPPSAQMELSEEDKSKDGFFIQIAGIAEAMIARHGKDFAIGTFLLTAKFIAEGKPLSKRTAGGGNVDVVKPS
jgi:hypothetical protein